MTRSLSRLAPLVLAAAFAAVLPVAPTGWPTAPSAALAQEAQPERYNGDIQLPGGAALNVTITIDRSGDEPSATVDIPAQGAFDVPLEIEELTDASAVLRITGPANAVFRLERADGGGWAGALEQAGMTFDVELEPTTEEASAPARPQTPEPPFPYETEEVEFPGGADGVTLAGTLSIPAGEGPHPAAFFVTGSGPQDRDETLFGHKPFAVIADHLARNGVASLRYDDRGVGGSTGDFASATSDDFASDAVAAMKYLRSRDEIAASEIALIGHSEGGLIGPMVATRAPELAYLVLLAPPGVEGREVLSSQLIAIMRASGVEEDAIAEAGELQTEFFDALENDAPEEELRPIVERIVEAQGMELEGGGEVVVDQQMQQMTTPWMRRFLSYDPRESLERITQPVLVLNGSLDLQVLTDVNFPALREALDAAPTDDATLIELPGLNHLFQEAETGGIEEYGALEQTMSPRVLDLITAWLRARTGLGG